MAELPTENNGIFSGNVKSVTHFSQAAPGNSISLTPSTQGADKFISIKVPDGAGSLTLKLKWFDANLRTFHVLYDLEKDLGVDSQIQDIKAKDKKNNELHSIKDVFANALIHVEIKNSTLPVLQDVYADGTPDPESIWSASELITALRTRISSLRTNFPWSIWLFECFKFENDIIDGTLIKGASNVDENRRGCAIFSGLKPGQLEERERARLRTMIHEIGHCFNLLHTDRRENVHDHSKCFMDPGSRVSPEYWNDFIFNFNDDSLMALHHGFYDDVCPGESEFKDPLFIFSEAESKTPSSNHNGLEFKIEVEQEASLGEPVLLQLTVKNKSTKNRRIYDSLTPQWGKCQITIAGKDNQIFEPILLYCGSPKRVTLQPEEQISELVWLHSSRKQMLFPSEGIYSINANWKLNDSTTLCANSASIQIKSSSSDLDKLIHDSFYNFKTSEFFEVSGSDCESMKSINSAVREIAERFPDEKIGCKCSSLIGTNSRRAFKTVTKKAIQIRQPEVEQAIKDFSAAVNSRQNSRIVNQFTEKKLHEMLNAIEGDHRTEVKNRIYNKRSK